MPIYVLLFFISSLTFANFKSVSIDQLNFVYSKSHGLGSVEKVNLGYSFLDAPYPLEVHKTESSFELVSEFINVTWSNPWSFVFELEKTEIKNTTFSFGKEKHFIESEHILVKPKGRGDYQSEGLKASCLGKSDGDLLRRLMDDCHQQMDVSIKRVDVPTDFIFYKILANIPITPEDAEYPADDFKLNIKNGDFSLVFYFKYYFYAGLRSWGNFQYENNHQTIVIRVDKIKFGFLNVTNYVMNKLKEVVTNPQVKVEPPYIKINLDNKK